MKKVKKLLKISFIMLFTFWQTASSQVTTSSMSGNVSDAGGAMPGTTVMVTHVPTGTQTGTITDSKGNFNLQSMRPGGPYKVTFSFIGYKTVEYQDVTLLLSDMLVLNVHMEEDSRQLNEVIVIGSAEVTNMSSSRAGAITHISTEDIASMPTVSRSINDLMRLTPQAYRQGANGPAIGGGHYRQNFITVDGAAFNNAFGIGQNLPGGGSPISIDALDQISINLTPYDVRQSGFIGAAVNAVTKSGTNEFKGSAYTYMTDDRLRGNKVEDDYFSHPPSKYNIYGFTLGGPIIKDKLFFFVNYETEKTVAPGPLRVASETGQSNTNLNIARPKASEMEEISKYLRDTYGYETGPYQGYSFDSPGQKFLARIDWNINNDHKLNVRYSYMDSKTPFLPSTSTRFSPPAGGNRQSMSAMWFQNSGYFQEQNFTSLSGELNSRFLDGKLNNTLRVTYSYQDEPRSTGGKTFPFVDILEDGEAFTCFGTELFSFGNLRQVKTWNFTDEITYRLGINNFTLGVSYETNHIKNGFMRQGAGHYVYNSWADFVSANDPNPANRANPLFYSITFSNTPGYEQVFPSFLFEQLSFYLQDEVKINNNLTLTGGLRVDLPIYPDFPEGLQTHPLIADLEFNGTKYNTAVMPKTQLMLSPRFGFNYDILGDRTVVLRGGTGIFTGRVPFVWICSQSGDAGMLQTTVEYRGADVAANAGPFNPDIHYYLPDVAPEAGTMIPTGGFTIMDPDFKMPQAWKSSLAVDFKLPFGFNASIEGVYNKDINAVMISNQGLVDPAAMSVPGYPDNRMIYPNGPDRFLVRLHGTTTLPDPAGASGAQPLLIHNVDDNGYYASVTFKLEKQMWEGLTGMIAYTRSWAESLHDGTGDQALSLWQGYTTVHGSNTPELGYAGYVMPSNLIGSLSYKYKGFTTSLFYIGGEDGRNSYTYTNNIVRDGNAFSGINLMYVPKDASEITFVEKTVSAGGVTVTYTPQEQSDAFFAYIEQDPYLKTRKGQYAEKNGLIFPWSHRFDVKFTQDFSVKAGNTNHTLQLGLDITNFGNLLNSNWGNRWATYQTQLLEVTNIAAIGTTAADGSVVAPTFRLNHIGGTTDLPTETFRKSLVAASTFQMQFSVRYYFN